METTSLLNTITASGADLTLVARKLNVAIAAANGSGSFPTINYPDIISATVSPAITETVLVSRVGWTAADNTQFLFTVTQVIDGQVVKMTANLGDSGVGATNTTIGTALAACFNGTALQVTCAYTPANAYVTITANAGYPIYQVTLGATGTMTYSTATTMAGVAIASSTVATPSVVTSVGHGLVNGSVITIVSADANKLPSGTFVVQYLTANTYSMYSLNGNQCPGITGTTTATVVKVAGGAVGSGTVLAARYATGAQGYAGLAAAAAGAGYAKYTFNYNIASVVAGQKVSTNASHVFYAKQWATTTTATYITNFAAFSVLMNEILSNYVAAGTGVTHTSLTDGVAIADVAPVAPVGTPILP